MLVFKSDGLLLIKGTNPESCSSVTYNTQYRSVSAWSKLGVFFFGLRVRYELIEVLDGVDDMCASLWLFELWTVALVPALRFVVNQHAVSYRSLGE